MLARLWGIAFFVTVSFLLLGGCASFWHPGSVGQTVDAEYGVVFQATIDALQKRRFSIKRADRKDGVIETNRRSLRDVRAKGPVEKATVRLKKKRNQNTRVTLLLVFGNQSSGSPHSVSHDGDDERADDLVEAVLDRAYDTGHVYDNYINSIKRHVRERLRNAENE